MSREWRQVLLTSPLLDLLAESNVLVGVRGATGVRISRVQSIGETGIASRAQL